MNPFIQTPIAMIAKYSELYMLKDLIIFFACPMYIIVFSNLIIITEDNKHFTYAKGALE